MRLLLHLLLFSLISLKVQAQVWSAGTNIPIPIRAGNTAAYSKDGDGFLFVVSGRDHNGLITQKHQRYQLSTNSWSEMADHPTGILGGATTILKDSLYVIGGLRTTPGSTWRRGYKYSISQNTWTQIANTPVNITDAKAVSYQDSLIYVTGGYTGNTYVYNSRYNRWRAATPIMPGESLSWGAFSVQNDTLVSICGTDGFLSDNYFNTLIVGVINQNDRAQITWTTATAFPGQTRTFFDAYPWKNGIIMTGGSTDNTFETNSNECYVYNAGTDVWTQLPSKPTSWLTGNSGSVKIGDNWSLICASGYGTGYLSETEILSTAPLSIAGNEKTTCNWKDFQIHYGKKTTIHFCTEDNGNIDVSLHDAHGRMVKNKERMTSKSGTHNFALDMDGLSKGVYYCSLQKDSVVATKKIIVLK